MRFAAGVLILSALIFLPAGTAAYWQAWVYLAIFFVPMMLVTVYLLKNDPDLLERRMRSREKNREQSLIIKLGSACCVLVFVLPGLDQRLEWSHVPVAAVVAAFVIELLGYVWFIMVLRANSYASRIIEVEQGQRVVTTGPYAVVRHPMYLGVLAMFLLTPVALASWWAMLSALPMILVLVARIRNEERLLVKELEGYLEYTRTTRYRLMPGVW